MYRLAVRDHLTDSSIASELSNLTERQILSRGYYSGYTQWFENTFLPGLVTGEREIISLRDKEYDTLMGFALLKRGVENKLCTISPLVGGLGITQAILDTSLFYFDRDFKIDVPLNDRTVKLHSRLKTLGFEIYEHGFSTDNTPQVTYVKPLNISWI